MTGFFRRAISRGFLAGFCLLLGSRPSGAAETSAYRLVSSDALGVTIEYTAPAPVLTDRETPFGTFQVIEMAGHAPLGELGRPALPVSGVGIAVPEGCEPRLTFEILESREQAGVRPLPAFEGPAVDPGRVTLKDGAAYDADVYGGALDYPAETVTLSEAGHLRNHRVGQIAVNPVRFHPRTGSVTIVSRARIRVDFAASQRRAALLPRQVPVGEERAWEETYRSTLLNYEAAKTFRTRALPDFERFPGDGAGAPGRSMTPRSGAPGRLPGRAPAVTALPSSAGAPEFRIFVGVTGLYAVGYSDLAAAGWPDDVRLDGIRFYEKTYNAADPASPIETDVPVSIVEAGVPDSVFNGTDVIYFYGLNVADRFHPDVATDRYTRLHAYWVSYGGAPGARMSEPAGWFDAPSFTTPVSYVHKTHWEEDKVYTFGRPELEVGFLPSLQPQKSSLYWIDRSVLIDSLQFLTPGRDPSLPFRVRARWQGYFRVDPGKFHIVRTWITRGCGSAASDTLIMGPATFGQADMYTYDSGFTIPGNRLADGCNRFKTQGNGSGNGDPATAGSGAYFDWFDVDYHRLYTVSGGTLRFTSGDATGNVEFAIRGLADSAAIVFDVTDSLRPARVNLEGARYRLVTRPISWEIRFRAAIDGQRTYVMFDPDQVPSVTRAVPGGHVPPDLGNAVIQKAPGTDVSSPPDADVIVLANPAFAPALASWKSRREAPPYNHRIWIVYPQEIWDEFSGGDKSVPAVREWLRHLYRNAADPPDYLMIFGDASEDYRHDLPTSDPDWVPTMMEYGPVYTDRYELIGSDSYYVRSLGAQDPDNDLFPDMHVGRLSVGSTAEAEAVLAKLAAYDTYSPGDTWRNRGLIVSDDRYSAPLSEVGDYCYSQADADFQRGGDSLLAIVTAHSCYTGFTCDHYKLEEVMGQAPCSVTRTNLPNDCKNRDEYATIVGCAEHFAMPRWVEMASRGHLFQMYSGHGNRFVMGTEWFVRFFGDQSSAASRTTEQLTNYGKPFVYFGVGCHLNEYENFQEAETQHSLGESMLMLPGRGAIASVASTGFEWLQTNLEVELYYGRTMFSNHPRDPVTGRPRLILGEGTDVALVRMALELGGNPNFRNTLRTYCLLGDPTLRIDMAPPQFQVEVDGVPVQSGDAVAPAPDASTIRITAKIADDVDYRADGFSITDNGRVVPAGEYTITPYNDAAPGACRGALVDYLATLEPAGYPITLRAVDWLGREMTFTLEVPLQVGYFVADQEIHTNDVLPVDADLEVRIQTPVGVTAADLDVLVNGEAGFFTLGGAGRSWTAVRSRELPEGALSLEVRVRGQSYGAIGLRAQKTATFGEIYFYPSPWEGHGTGQFTYQLSYRSGNRPRNLSVTVFTVSGRKVVSLQGPVETGRNTIAWDMKDQEGDGLANGVYIFKMTLETSTGQKLSTTDRLVVHR